MKIIKKLFCVHDYRLIFTCQYYSENGTERKVIEKCIKCKKKRKRNI